MPLNSPLAQPNSNTSLHCQPIRIEDGQGHVNYLGWAGGFSQSPNTIEISLELGQFLGYSDDQIITAQIEYSFDKLESVEIEPLTAHDFKIIEQNSNFIEENLLNQMQVFYKEQCFVLHLQNRLIARLKTIIKSRNHAKCFYLTQNCEMHIIPKTEDEEEAPAT